MMNGMFRIQNINNGTLKSVNAMPQKDLTSDGTSSFELGRSVYVNTYPNANQLQTVQNKQKKWMGNRDASQITTNNRNTSIGTGSINTTANTPQSFTTTTNVNVFRDAQSRCRLSAVARCRSGGCVAPAKKNVSKIGMMTNYRQSIVNQAMPSFIDRRTGQTITNYIQPINKSKTFLGKQYNDKIFLSM